MVRLFVQRQLYHDGVDRTRGRPRNWQPPDSSFAGSLRPQGVAFAVDGGYRVSGRWDFVSGVDHAKWLLCTCKVVDAAGPVMRRTGVQDTRTLVLPIKSVQVHDV